MKKGKLEKGELEKGETEKGKKKIRGIVLGGTGYLGSAICRILAEDQIEIALTYYQNEPKAEELKKEFPHYCHTYPLDLRSFEKIPQALQSMVEQLGNVDFMIQCAGFSGQHKLYHSFDPTQNLLATSLLEWDQMQEISVKSTFLACQVLAPLMIKQGGGQLIFLGALNAVKSVPLPVHYATSQGALKSMVETLAKSLGPSSVLVNLVAPGILEGGIGQLLNQELKERYLKHCSLHRFGTAQEVATFIAWLIQKNRYITGETLLLDGGV